MPEFHEYGDGARPFITLKWAQSIDGQLADDRDQSQWISGSEERRYTHHVRAANDAVLVGAQTFIKDRCKLTVREAPLRGEQPVRVILDPRGRVIEAVRRDPVLWRELSEGDRTTYILTDVTDQPDRSTIPGDVRVITYRLESLEEWLAGVVYLFSREFERLEGRPLKRIMVEGGAFTLALFLRAGLADRLEVAVSPLIIGGKKNRVETGGLLSGASRYRLESQERFGPDVVLRYEAPESQEQRSNR